MRTLAHNLENSIRDFFALHGHELEFPAVFVGINILFVLFIYLTK